MNDFQVISEAISKPDDLDFEEPEKKEDDDFVHVPEVPVFQEKSYDNQISGMLSRMKRVKTCFMTIGGKGSECCLIYIAISKNTKESVSHLRKQL